MYSAFATLGYYKQPSSRKFSRELDGRGREIFLAKYLQILSQRCPISGSSLDAAESPSTGGASDVVPRSLESEVPAEVSSSLERSAVEAPDEGCVKTSWKSAGGTDAGKAIGIRQSQIMSLRWCRSLSVLAIPESIFI
ncbi:hypothetical protein TNCV_411621 [Trichonephila clavipes]|nr:hypothetical protein TNCV_411621 [Trichonephila clavipes]